MCDEKDGISTVAVLLLGPKVTSVKEAALQKSSMLSGGGSSTASSRSGSARFLLAVSRALDVGSFLISLNTVVLCFFLAKEGLGFIEIFQGGCGNIGVGPIVGALAALAALPLLRRLRL